jgi:hypothetical protein
MPRSSILVLVMLPVLAGSGWAQQADGAARQPPVIDSIIIVTENVFDSAEARRNTLFRIANAIRFKTNTSVVRRELLFRVGDRYDSATVAESERNLRALGVFRDVTIDTLRLPEGLAVEVRTADGWSTQLNLNGRSTGGRFTWQAEVAEQNFLGTATVVDASYRNDPDRTATRFGVRFRRLFNSHLTANGFFEKLSDGTRGGWRIGAPFRAFSDRRAFDIVGERADQRILQFIVRSVSDQDTVEYQRRAFVNRGTVAIAPVATTSHYLRVGASALVRREEYLLRSDRDLAIPDTVTGAIGAFAEFRRANFKVVTHYNGFAQDEDLDLSTVVRLSAWLAPSSFGYERTGIGPRLSMTSGASLPFGFLRIAAQANGLFTSVGLDSGRVTAGMTLGSQLIPRQATFLFVQGGLLKRSTPGHEFDLGHGLGPRSFGPHAFVGDRMVWGTFEHRIFLVDDFLRLLGIGIAGFVDYGGAWFDGNDPQFGGSVGFGLRLGATRAIGVNVGRFDIGYRFGDGWTGNHWVLSTGRGFAF